jgi:pimeloyl-ACP methyl ester carboxylesterase
VLTREVVVASSPASLGSGAHHVLANAGHYPMFETPVALAAPIERFLGRE